MRTYMYTKLEKWASRRFGCFGRVVHALLPFIVEEVKEISPAISEITVEADFESCNNRPESCSIFTMIFLARRKSQSEIKRHL